MALPRTQNVGSGKPQTPLVQLQGRGAALTALPWGTARRMARSLAGFGGSERLDSTNIQTTGYSPKSNPVPNFPRLLVTHRQQIPVCETRTGSDRRLASAPPADNALFVGSWWEQPHTCLYCIRTELGEKSDYPNYSEMLNMCRIQFG